VSDSATGPIGKEDRDDLVADLKRLDTIADGENLAGAIGHRNETVLHGLSPNGKHIVMIVERARTQAHLDLAGAGLTGLRHVYDLQPVKPARRA
jgi:hypothetical protein